MTFFKKILGAAVVATLAMSVVATSASAHNPQNYKGPGILPALAGPIGAAALFPTTSTFHWTTIATQKWYYPWSYKPFNFGNVVHQGANAVQQHVSNIYNPHYFNESIHLTGPDKIFKPDYGAHKVKADYKVKHSKSKSGINGKIAVGCIFGSALAVITASVRKASAMGNPPRWRSQAEHEKIVASGYEKQFELTNDEASTAVALCGLGSFALHWQKTAPVKAHVVKARY
jgi:hypothetical protein